MERDRRALTLEDFLDAAVVRAEAKSKRAGKIAQACALHDAYDLQVVRGGRGMTLLNGHIRGDDHLGCDRPQIEPRPDWIQGLAWGAVFLGWPTLLLICWAFDLL